VSVEVPPSVTPNHECYVPSSVPGTKVLALVPVEHPDTVLWAWRIDTSTIVQMDPSPLTCYGEDD